MPNTSLISIVVSQGIEMYSILPQQKEHYNEVTVDWQHTIIYLLWVDVIWMLCRGQYGKGFTDRTERLLLFLCLYTISAET